MSNFCAAVFLVLTVFIMAPGPTASGPTLNPLLQLQAPGTWARLPKTGAVHPQRIARHPGGAIDPATSILYLFGSDTRGNEWNKEVWSYDPVRMTWAQSYPADAPATYRYLDGRKTTTTGHPWAKDSLVMRGMSIAANWSWGRGRCTTA
jgi:hypothetical protein